LNRFANETELKPEHPIYQVMCMVGEDIVNYLRSLRTRLDFLKQHSEYWTIETDGEPIRALFLAQHETIANDPSFGLYAFIEDRGKEEEIEALIYPDRRGEGYGLTRYNDNQRLNFSQIETCEDVRFAHKNRRNACTFRKAFLPDLFRDCVLFLTAIRITRRVRK